MASAHAYESRRRAASWGLVLMALAGCGGAPTPDTARPCAGACDQVASQQPGVRPAPADGPALKTVFLIVMENHNWSQIAGSGDAPYINSLLTQGAHATQYFNPPGLHPSEPNYVWIEAGTNQFTDHSFDSDDDPSESNSTASTDHLVTYLARAGISWTAWQEDISGQECPLSNSGKYMVRHDPTLFFQDSTGNNNASDEACIARNRPYTELAAALQAGTVPRYNFITPNKCHDMHSICSFHLVKQGDDWLKAELPKILGSDAYKKGGVVFITWDEGEGSLSDGPIGMIALSPMAKPGYAGSIHYDHSSLLKSVQTILGVGPLLGHAADAQTQDLGDLFLQFP